MVIQVHFVKRIIGTLGDEIILKMSYITETDLKKINVASHIIFN